MEASIKQENKPNLRVPVHVRLSQIDEQLTFDVNIVVDTIYNVKAKIQSKEAIPIKKIDLFYSGEELKNSRSLSSYGIRGESTLYAIFPATHTMQINVCMENDNRTIRVKVKSWYTVENVKDVVESMVGIPSYKQRFYIGSRKLENHQTLEELNISSGQTLTMFDSFIIYLEKRKSYGRESSQSKMVVKVTESDTIADLRKKAKTGCILLFFDGKHLQDSHTLADYKIGKEDTIWPQQGGYDSSPEHYCPRSPKYCPNSPS